MHHHHAPGPAPGRPPGGNPYLDQVRELSPRLLRDRDAELAELAAFSTDPDDAAPSYAWWRGGPWAGKSALMAWFVLHPPPGVQIVAFFITARYAGQNTREAYLETTIPQLAALAGVDSDLAAGERRQRDQLFALYRRAAEAVRARGSRLVLLLDGVDEDGGISAGPSAHSIAGLLPQRPPGGLRVLVAGRPNPPIPDDVSPGHPLRAPSVIRELLPSAHARTIRADARNSLQHLLEDTGGPGRDILGLITAAGGGLTLDDLSELTDAPPYRVGTRLRSTAARTFLTQRSRYDAGQGRELYILGHEELQQASVESFGPRLLAAFRDRLHAWAAGYAERGWPASTPEYLLRGYPRMLHADGDAVRLTTLALDLERQERLLAVTGGDAAALGGILRAQDLRRGGARPGGADLAALARLALHRYRINAHNSRFPARLPALWYRAGYPTRAENLAYNLADPARRVGALALLAEAAWRSGARHRARGFLADAERTLAHITVAPGHPDDDRGPRDLLIGAATELEAWDAAELLAAGADRREAELRGRAAVAVALAEAGEGQRAREVLGRALELADRLPRAELETHSVAAVVRAVPPTGTDPSAAVPLLHKAREAVCAGAASEHPSALLPLAGAAAALGEVSTATALLNDVTARARSLPSLDEAVRAISLAAAAAGDMGRTRLAHALLAEAERTAERIPEETNRNTALTHLAAAAARAGDWERAGRLADGQSAYDIRGLMHLADRALGNGDGERALAWLDKADAAWRAFREPDELGGTVAAGMLADVAARAGRPQLADRALRLIPDSAQRAEVLAELAERRIGAGDGPGAIARLEESEDSVRSHLQPGRTAWALSALARALSATGDRTRTVALLAAAEAAADRIHGAEAWTYAQAEIAAALVGCGCPDVGESLVRRVPPGPCKAGALALVARSMSRHGYRTRAADLLAEADAQEASAWAPDRDESSLVEFLTRCAVEIGDLRRAEAFSRRPGDDSERAAALLALAEGWARAGDGERVAELIARYREQWPGVRSPVLDRGMGGIALATAEAGDMGRAERLARSVSDPGLRACVLASLAAHVSAGGGPSAERLLTESGELADPLGADRGRRHAEMAVAAARCGRWTLAERWSRRISATARRARVLTRLGAEAARSGDARRGRRFLAEAGDLVRSLPRTGGTAELLRGMAMVLDDADRARALAAEALCVPWEDAELLGWDDLPVPRPRLSRWPEDLEMLAKVAPEALAALADEFLRVFAAPDGL